MDIDTIGDCPVPSILTTCGLSANSTAFEWVNRGRPRALALLKKMFGEQLPRPQSASYELLCRRDNALNGAAIREEVRLHFQNNGKTHCADLLLYVPKHVTTPPPVFVGLNVKGNHSQTTERDVALTGGSLPENPDFCDQIRSVQAHRCNFNEVIHRGYASATVCYHDFSPDAVDGWKNSALNLFTDVSDQVGALDKYSAIGVWSWGLSRILDYLESNPLVDATRAVVYGHSRLGKTALWAGALDTRFKIVISNDSGCCGAAISRRCVGETVEKITSVFPHWFVKSFRQYADKENDLPFDQHFLLAMTAPRLLCVGSAAEDHWADPLGEFLGAKHTDEIYRLFGSKGLTLGEMPPLDAVITGDVSYHIRRGKHDLTPTDWQSYLEVADRLWR